MWIFSQSERIKTNLAQLLAKEVERIAPKKRLRAYVCARQASRGADMSRLGNNTSDAFRGMTGIVIILSYTSENIRRVQPDMQGVPDNGEEFRNQTCLCISPPITPTG